MMYNKDHTPRIFLGLTSWMGDCGNWQHESEIPTHMLATACSSYQPTLSSLQGIGCDHSCKRDEEYLLEICIIKSKKITYLN